MTQTASHTVTQEDSDTNTPLLEQKCELRHKLTNMQQKWTKWHNLWGILTGTLGDIKRQRREQRVYAISIHLKAEFIW